MSTIHIYCRVSSKSQDTRAQEGDLKKWAEGRDNVVWYRDKFTGKSMDRPGWNKLIAAMRPGDTLVCWRLDRLGRTCSGLAKLFEELTAKKVNLVSIKDSIDLATAAGRLMANVLASVAAYETEVRSERQLAGIAAAKEAGKTWGGSEKGRQLHVSDEQVAIIRRMKAEGAKVAAIARATGLSRPSVYRWL